MKRILALVFALALCAFAWARTPDDSTSVAGGLCFRDAVSPYQSGKKLKAWNSQTWAPVFNGADSYGYAALIATAAGDFTVMGWQKVDRYESTDYWWYAYGAPSARSQMGQAASSKWGFSLAGTAYTSNSVVTVGDWVHLAAVRSGGNVLLYKNGVYDTTTTATTTANLFSGTFHVGKFNSGISNIPESGMAELAVFDTALSAADVQKYYAKRLKGSEQNLLHLWHLDDGPGATQFADSGPNNKPLDIYGGMKWAPRSTPYFGDIRDSQYCVYFDGTDDVATGAWNGTAATYPATLEAWVFVASSATGALGGFGTYYAPAAASTTVYTRNIMFYSTTAATCPLYMQVYANPSGGRDAIANMAEKTGWHHVAAVYDKSGSNYTSVLYCDGNIVASASNAIFFDTATHNGIMAGAWRFSNGAFQFTKSRMCELRIWDTARTQTQIRDNMFKTLAGNEAGLRHYYKCNEGGGTTLNDSVSSGGSNLTLYNGVAWVGRSMTQDYEQNPKSDNFAVRLDGTNDILRNSAIASTSWGSPNSAGVTFGGWANRLATGTTSTADDGIFLLYVNSTNYYSIGWRDTGDIILRTRGSGIVYLATATAPVANGWAHLAASVMTTATGTIGNIYINGTLAQTGTNVASPTVSGATSVYLGQNSDGSGDFFQGDLADQFLYRRILSQSEIQSLMTARPSDFSDGTLIGYWPLNEGGNLPFAFDYSTSSLGGQYFQNLALTNGPTWARRSIP